MALRYRLLLPLFGALVACASPVLYHRPGADPVQVEAERTRCEVAALREVPRDIRTRYHPPQYAPSVRCSPRGYCLQHYGLIAPGRAESYDANAGLRAGVVDQCMMQAGFRPVTLPRCAPGTEAADAADGAAAQSDLAPDSCALRLPSGQWRIATPG